MAQLKIFGAMGAKIDPDNAEYRMHRLVNVAERRYGDWFARLADRPEEPIEPASLAAAPGPGEQHPTLVRCRVCRCHVVCP